MRAYFNIQLFAFMIIYICSCFSQKRQDLSAARDASLYTTFAAAIQRFGFIPDEGSYLRFYDPEKGINFLTDKSGNWCLSFKRDENYVYELNTMFKQLVITTSYPDMVKYEYYPLKDIKVKCYFFSSRFPSG